MSTLTGPTDTPYSSARRASCAAYALAISVLVESRRERRPGLPGADDDRVELLRHDVLLRGFNVGRAARKPHAAPARA
jgi:hypothetical protein